MATGLEFIKGKNLGTSNGTSAVTVVSAPVGENRRVVDNIVVYNKDDATVTMTLTVNDGTTSYTLTKLSLDMGDTLFYDVPISLDNSSSTIQLVLSGSVNSTEIEFMASYGDIF